VPCVWSNFKIEVVMRAIKQRVVSEGRGVPGIGTPSMDMGKSFLAQVRDNWFVYLFKIRFVLFFSMKSVLGEALTLLKMNP
jgi:hypothetical protein